jgi:hypothetical protein
VTRHRSAGHVVRRLGRTVLPQGTLRGIRRRRRVDPWAHDPWVSVRPHDLQDGIDIWPLVSPLRYDVLLRRDFMATLARNPEAYGVDETAFMDAVGRTPYHTWFFESEVVRTGLLGRDQAVLEAHFTDRVRRAVALFQRLEAAGGALDEPIVLKTAEVIRPPTTDRLGPPTGKPVSARYFVADGCHRLAYLMLAGRTRLAPSEFRVKSYRAFSPFDSTSLLLPRLRVAPADYFAYLSMGYASPASFTDGDSLLAHLQASRPDVVEEVAAVIRVDGYSTLGASDPA